MNRDEPRTLAEEQAALRRVATLVAGEVAAEAVFAAVTEEVGQLLSVELANMGRYESDGTVTVLASWGEAATGIRSSVDTPIMVEGRLWGVMSVGSARGPALPADTEARLASFTELVATAIANAESRAGLAQLVIEQAALRRVATLAARAAAPEEVFAAVTAEIGQLLPVGFSLMGRYEADETVTFVAVWGAAAASFPIGSRWSVGGNNIATLVFQTGSLARIDDYADGSSGPIAEVGRERGFDSLVGAPILVEGRVWGVMAVGSTAREPPLPAGTESRLAEFTDLLATAVANAESGAGLARLVEEQAALRRVATLVAGGAPEEDVFGAVVEEAGRLLEVDVANLGRYEPDGAITNLAAWSGEGTPSPDVGSGLISETGVRSSVETPIIVEGHLWGVMGAGSKADRPLPSDAEARLASFTELVVTAIANAESRAALAASRARIVAAADESRRRIERDLHDGAQQRLVHAVIVIKLALRALASGETDGTELVAEALRHAEQANAELRELAHGILPAALIRGGLRAGVEAIVSRMSLPVRVDVSVERLPPGVEATAYFVVSEALTNAVKHARAASATVTAAVDGRELRVEVCDDGIGGAQTGERSGLEGLEDRVSALDGRLVIESPTGGGTRVCALLPVP